MAIQRPCSSAEMRVLVRRRAAGVDERHGSRAARWRTAANPPILLSSSTIFLLGSAVRMKCSTSGQRYASGSRASSTLYRVLTFQFSALRAVLHLPGKGGTPVLYLARLMAEQGDDTCPVFGMDARQIASARLTSSTTSAASTTRTNSL